MRLLLVHGDLEAGGGAEAYADAILRWLSARGHSADRLDIHGLRGAGRTRDPVPLRFGRLPGLRHLHLFKYALVCRVLPGLAAGYDLVLLTYGEAPDPGPPAITLRHAPALFTTDPARLDALGAAGRPKAYRTLRQVYAQASAGLAGFHGAAPGPVLVNSRWTAGTLSQTQSGKAPAVLYPPVRARRVAEGVRTRAGLLALGRMVPSKRLDEAIAITQRLRACGIPATLDIAGRAGTRHARRLMRRHRGKTFVRFHPDACAETLDHLLARARFGLHCYRHEHFGIAVAEMITAGVLPLVHDSGGVRELVTLPRLRFATAAQAADRLARLIALPDHETRAMAETLRQGAALRAALDFEGQLERRLAPLLEPG